MDNLPAGWKKGATSTDNDSLFKLYKMESLAASFAALDHVRQAVLEGDFKECTFITLSNDALTITINDLGEDRPPEDIAAFAAALDDLLEA